LNLAAEVIQSSEQAPDHLGAIAASEMIGTKIFVFDPILEHVPSGGKHRGSDRKDRFLHTAARLQTQELGLQVATLDADRGPGGPSRVRLERRLPALSSSFLGHIVAQDSKCPAVGKRAMSTPISATKTCAVSSLTPGIVVSRRALSWIGAMVFGRVPDLRFAAEASRQIAACI